MIMRWESNQGSLHYTNDYLSILNIILLFELFLSCHMTEKLQALSLVFQKIIKEQYWDHFGQVILKYVLSYYFIIFSHVYCLLYNLLPLFI